MGQREDAIEFLEKAREILSNDKKKIYSGLYQLKQAALLLKEENLITWVNLELGDERVIREVKKIIEELQSAREKQERYNLPITILNGKKFNFQAFLDSGEVKHKLSSASGGFRSIEAIENMFETSLKKQGNNGTEYKNNVLDHLSLVRSNALEKASALYNEIKYTDSLRDGFDILKENIDDKLLDLNPVIAEQLMLSFKSMNSKVAEERSQALTTARRFLKELADTIYPPRQAVIGDRKLGEEQYINRIWAFMDESIASRGDKASAKSLVDLIGLNIQNLYKGTNKGVHAEVSETQSILFIFQIYIMVGYLLDYLDRSVKSEEKININDATLDELESTLEVSRSIAKKIVKSRVLLGGITESHLKEISGVGSKTISKAKEFFDFS
ncbi:ComEA family DNA-binding protein [Marinilactibacillus psychrotolerans]|uniref:ComEA family DNA-binding protein n=1 Tax=Marinilactibacillus psychrotolerans TaxID=191770 RepID=UPI001D022DB2|nr:helix-hairpin-helix domain-containing protein [Marinilactibacillus psychrotolerans]